MAIPSPCIDNVIGAVAGMSHAEAIQREEQLVAEMRASSEVVLARSADLRSGIAEPLLVKLQKSVIETEKELVEASGRRTSA